MRAGADFSSTVGTAIQLISNSSRPRNSERSSFQAEYVSSTRSVGIARKKLDEWLDQSGVSVSARADAALVVSELATNAVEASSDTPFGVAAALHPGSDRLDIVVTNHGAPPLPNLADWDTKSAIRPRGRGLMIVKSVAAEVRVERRDLTNIVRATVVAPQSPGLG